MAGHPTTYAQIAFVLCAAIGIPGSGVAAQAPVWEENIDVDPTAFRYVAEVPSVDVVVPTVVELPLDVILFDSYSTVARDDTGRYSVALFTNRATYQDIRQSVIAGPGEGPITELSDNDVSTLHDVPFASDGSNSTTYTIVMSKPVTVAEVVLRLGENVALPETVAVTARTPAEPERDTVLVAERTLTGTRVQVPPTRVQSLTVMLGHSQPLRLAELAAVPEVAVSYTPVLRFLAQPGRAYTVLADADRPYGTVEGRGVDLVSDVGVLTLETATFDTNPVYVPSDRDGDGVPDAYDNCPTLANTKQHDFDLNGVGDACDDFDTDGVLNALDNCPDEPNIGQQDDDADGIGNVCDGEEDRVTEQYPWIPWAGLGIAALMLGAMVLSAFRSKRFVFERTEVVDDGR
jgi:hypothetical protein